MIVARSAAYTTTSHSSQRVPRCSMSKTSAVGAITTAIAPPRSRNTPNRTPRALVARWRSSRYVAGVAECAHCRSRRTRRSRCSPRLCLRGPNPASRILPRISSRSWADARSPAARTMMRSSASCELGLTQPSRHSGSRSGGRLASVSVYGRRRGRGPSLRTRQSRGCRRAGSRGRRHPSRCTSRQTCSA